MQQVAASSIKKKFSVNGLWKNFFEVEEPDIDDYPILGVLVGRNMKTRLSLYLVYIKDIVLYTHPVKLHRLIFIQHLLILPYTSYLNIKNSNNLFTFSEPTFFIRKFLTQVVYIATLYCWLLGNNLCIHNLS